MTCGQLDGEREGFALHPPGSCPCVMPLCRWGMWVVRGKCGQAGGQEPLGGHRQGTQMLLECKRVMENGRGGGALHCPRACSLFSPPHKEQSGSISRADPGACHGPPMPTAVNPVRFPGSWVGGQPSGRPSLVQGSCHIPKGAPVAESRGHKAEARVESDGERVALALVRRLLSHRGLDRTEQCLSSGCHSKVPGTRATDIYSSGFWSL